MVMVVVAVVEVAVLESMCAPMPKAAQMPLLLKSH
jgi:hypothetical protein